jgi:predicted PurR-regulated permease PerM
MSDEPPVSERSSTAVPSSTATTVIATLAVIAALWWGQRFLIPIVAGLMLAMLVMPITVRLAGWLHSAAAAAILTLAVVTGAMAASAMAFGNQLVRVVERAPDMISMVAQQLTERDPNADSVLTRARGALQELDRAADHMVAGKPLSRPGRRAAAAAHAASAAAPNNSITSGATVVMRDTAVSGSNVLLGFFGNLTVIFFIAFFVLTGGKLLTEKFLGLWSYRADVHAHAQRALLECGRQIRIYCGVLIVTNIVIGLAVWLAFSLAGLPDAAGWGAAAAVLHLVPYLGMALLITLGSAEAFLVHETIAAALGMGGLLMVLSTVIGTFVTFWLQGRAAKMNPAAMFVGLVFWGALWGIWGLFLGPALVVLLKVAAENSRHGPQLAKLMQD